MCHWGIDTNLYTNTIILAGNMESVIICKLKQAHKFLASLILKCSAFTFIKQLSITHNRMHHFSHLGSSGKLSAMEVNKFKDRQE